MNGDIVGGFLMTLPMLGSIVAVAIVLSIFWTPAISKLVSGPMSGLYDGGSALEKTKAGYSTAIARRKLGKPVEAILEIRSQLARFPNDLEGTMLLAAIQAEDLKDLASAEVTLNHFCSQPESPPRQFAAALNQLADWHLKLAQDPDSARLALQRIADQFPDTDLSLLALQRIAHLPDAENPGMASSERPPVPVPEGIHNLGLKPASEPPPPAEEDPVQLAGAYVKHLEQHPLDLEVREKLAAIYADHFQRLDIATTELWQMIEFPGQPARRVAQWLNLLADFQIRHGAAHDTVRQTLGEIVSRFPGTAPAEMAVRRMDRLELELKGQSHRQSIKLGVYEQNIGLKYGPPHKL
jgi:hypothetical protein